MEQPILDMCCGSRMFWMDKQDDRALFTDRREEQHVLCDGRTLQISPTSLPTFALFLSRITLLPKWCLIRLIWSA